MLTSIVEIGLAKERGFELCTIAASASTRLQPSDVGPCRRIATESGSSQGPGVATEPTEELLLLTNTSQPRVGRCCLSFPTGRPVSIVC